MKEGKRIIPGQLTRITSQTFWNEVALDLNGKTWSTQNSNDNVYSTITDAAQVARAVRGKPAGTTFTMVVKRGDGASATARHAA